MAEYSKTALIVKVAKLYFEVGMSQAEIAQELDISRSYVSRLLTDAKEQGIVSIAVRDPEETESALEKTIRQHYGLRKVIVSGGGLEGNGVYEVAKDAAKWLNSTVKSGDVIGIGWGRTLYLLSRHLPRRADLSQVEVVALYGQQCMLRQNVYNTDGLSQFSEAFQASGYIMAAPVFMSTADAKQRFFQEKSIEVVREHMRRVNVALFTIGTMRRSSFVDQPGGLTEEELHRLADMDVSGEVCLHFINHQGKICDPVIDSRTVSIPFEELLQKETRVAVVSGRLKTEAVCSALEGGIVNVLICDEDIARGIVVRIHEKERI